MSFLAATVDQPMHNLQHIMKKSVCGVWCEEVAVNTVKYKIILG